MNAKTIAFLLLTLSFFATGCKPKEVSSQPTNGSTDVVTKPQPEVNPADKPVDKPADQSPACAIINQGPVKYTDMLFGLESKIEGDCINLNYEYTGGCKDHAIDLYWTGNWAETVPPVTKIYISHNAFGDECKMMVSAKKAFDLKPLRYQGLNEVKIDLIAQGAKPMSVIYKY
jgi:hypothetical protein